MRSSDLEELFKPAEESFKPAADLAIAIAISVIVLAGLICCGIGFAIGLLF